MDVTDILRDRVHEPEGLQRMAIVSASLHVVTALALMAAPAGWFSARSEPAPRTVMTITLGGGAPGPANTGMTQLAARPVQAETPLDAPTRRPEPVRPPAARTPEMVIPRADAAPRPKATSPPPRIADAPPEARGTTPARGDQTRSGQGVAETEARGFGQGLASGGSGSGTGVRLDVANFCCPEYIEFMVERIRSNWDSQAEIPANVEVRVTIQRNGMLTDVRIERTSGYQALDINAMRAISATRQLPALPAAYTNPTLTAYLTFEYTR